MDVIWGITYDETLGNRVKFTILAAGFDADSDNDASEAKLDVRPAARPADADVSRKPIDKEKIADYYGTEKIDDLQRLKEQQRYIILSPDQIDNDDIIETLERTPAYNRDKKMAARSVKAPGQAVPNPAPQPEESTRGQQPPAKPGNNVVFFSDDE